MFPELNFPSYAFDVEGTEQAPQVFDPIRRIKIALTPEEWVRLHTVQFLIQERHCPPGLISLEHSFTFEGRHRRADVVVFGRGGKPVIMVECKATSVAISQNVFDQIARYNKVVNAGILVVTNGLAHYCYSVGMDKAGRTTFAFHADIPDFETLVG